LRERRKALKLPHKKRIRVAVELLSELSKQIDSITRSEAVNMLKKAYSTHKLQPIKGKATPADIFDKEMATLYVVGKYGLHLHLDSPELFGKVFYIEEELDGAINEVLSGNYEKASEKLKKMSPSGTIDGNAIARMLRIPLTKYILGFSSEEELREVLLKTLEAFPQEERTIKNYVRFFISLKLSEMIYKGEIRSREEKEAYKKALAIRIGFPKVAPSDDYIRAVAKSVFGISDTVLNRVLKLPEGKKADQREA